VLYAFVTYYPYPVHWREYLHVGGAIWYVGYLGNVKVFLQNAWPGAAVLTPLWSLQVEEQFYLSFPLLVWAVRRKTLARILLASVIAAFVLRVILTLAMPGNKAGTYVLMPCRMDALAMGGLIAIARRDSRELLESRWIGRATAGCALIYLVVCLIYWEQPWSAAMRTIGFTAIDLGFTGILVMLINGRHRVLTSLCRLRILVWLGTISYGVYLLHIPAKMVADGWLAPRLGITPLGSTAMFLSMAVAISAASVSWLAFESQVLKLKERFTI
jgi:peptidoglycan/LPS O-acetylase OafA/YrhL